MERQTARGRARIYERISVGGNSCEKSNKPESGEEEQSRLIRPDC